MSNERQRLLVLGVSVGVAVSLALTVSNTLASPETKSKGEKTSQVSESGQSTKPVPPGGGGVGCKAKGGVLCP